MDLILLVREQCGQSNWTLGEQAAEWTERYAKGRTDAAFVDLVGEGYGLTVDRVGRCRRVWSDFGKTRGQFPRLCWSHFDKARTLPEMLQHEALGWAEEMEATVAEMLAWIRVTHGVQQRDEDRETETSQFCEGGTSPRSGETETSQFCEPRSGELAAGETRPVVAAVPRKTRPSMTSMDESVLGETETSQFCEGGTGPRSGETETSQFLGEDPESEAADVETPGGEDASSEAPIPREASERLRVDSVCRNVVRCLKLEADALRSIGGAMNAAERGRVVLALGEVETAILAPGPGLDTQRIHHKLRLLVQILTRTEWQRLREADRLYLAEPIMELHDVAMSTWRGNPGED